VVATRHRLPGSRTVALVMALGCLSSPSGSRAEDRDSIDLPTAFIGAGLAVATTGFLIDEEMGWSESGEGPGKFYAVGGAFAAIGLTLHLLGAQPEETVQVSDVRWPEGTERGLRLSVGVYAGATGGLDPGLGLWAAFD